MTNDECSNDESMTNARMTKRRSHCPFVIRHLVFVIGSSFEHSSFVISEEPLTPTHSPEYRGEGAKHFSRAVGGGGGLFLWRRRLRQEQAPDLRDDRAG